MTIPRATKLLYSPPRQPIVHFDWTSSSRHCSSAAEIFHFRLIRIHTNAKNSISSYLQGRTQTIQIGSFISEEKNISFGVPQGSVLGPLFFIIYINDIQECSDKLQFFLFADDTNILYADSNVKSLEETVNQELCKLYMCDWLTAYKLILNIQKTNFVIFCPAQREFTVQPNFMIFDNEKNKHVSLERK